MCASYHCDILFLGGEREAVYQASAVGTGLEHPVAGFLHQEGRSGPDRERRLARLKV